MHVTYPSTYFFLYNLIQCIIMPLKCGLGFFICCSFYGNILFKPAENKFNIQQRTAQVILCKPTTLWSTRFPVSLGTINDRVLTSPNWQTYCTVTCVISIFVSVISFVSSLTLTSMYSVAFEGNCTFVYESAFFPYIS